MQWRTAADRERIRDWAVRCENEMQHQARLNMEKAAEIARLREVIDEAIKKSNEQLAEAHAAMDNDPSKIIRNAKDGYPEGRPDHELTLAERISALCRYASDYKKWLAEAESKYHTLDQEWDAEFSALRRQLAATNELLVARTKMLEGQASENSRLTKQLREITIEGASKKLLAATQAISILLRFHPESPETGAELPSEHWTLGYREAVEAAKACLPK